MFLPGTYRLEATPAAAILRTQQVREADGFPDMRISKSGKQVFPENLDANPEKSGFCGKSSTPAHVDSFLSHSFLLPQRNCASVGTARALGDNKKSPTENLAAANAHEVITACGCN